MAIRSPLAAGTIIAAKVWETDCHTSVRAYFAMTVAVGTQMLKLATFSIKERALLQCFRTVLRFLSVGGGILDAPSYDGTACKWGVRDSTPYGWYRVFRKASIRSRPFFSSSSL